MTKEKLIAVSRQIEPFVHRTPIVQSTTINNMVGTQLHFKCENFQKMGAFKMRGATNAIMQLTEAERRRGVVTHSSGNFAQALALAAQKLGVTARIVMPNNTSMVKMEAVKNYGGIITKCQPTIQAREENARKVQEETGATFIHPSNNIDVINGNATVALELIEATPELNMIYVPVGGGGLIAGTILAAAAIDNSIKIIGAEPAEADDAYRSLLTGKIETNETTNTIAEGLKSYLGDINFPIIKQGVKHIVRISENEIIAAMRIIWERMKIIVEPSSAVAFAAVLKEKENLKNKKVGILLTGGNVDISNLPF